MRLQQLENLELYLQPHGKSFYLEHEHKTFYATFYWQRTKLFLSPFLREQMRFDKMFMLDLKVEQLASDVNSWAVLVYF